MTPEARAKALLPKLLVTSDAPIRAAHEILLATALREAEQSALERAAKVADKTEREERERRDDETQDDDFVSSAESRRVTAAYIAQSIRDLGRRA